MLHIVHSLMSPWPISSFTDFFEAAAEQFNDSEPNWFKVTVKLMTETLKLS